MYLAFGQILVPLLCWAENWPCFQNSPPALTDWLKGRGWEGQRSFLGQTGVTGTSSDKGQRRRSHWSPLVSRKFLEPLGEAVTPGTKRLDP